MNADLLSLLRAADPAAAMPHMPPGDRKRLRRAIAAEPAPPRCRFWRRRPRRRLIVAAVMIGVLVLLAVSSVWAASLLLQPIARGPRPPESAARYRAEYGAWTKKIPLPAGAHWLTVPAGAHWLWSHGNGIASAGEGHRDAVYQAMGFWTREWLAADAAGDTERATATQAWVSRLLATIPVESKGDVQKALASRYGTESMLGMYPDEAAYYEGAVARARRGHFARLVRAFVGLSIDPPTVPQPAPTPSLSHEVEWASTGGNKHTTLESTVPVTRDQARAECRIVIRAVGVPPGSDVTRHLLDGVPAAMDPTTWPDDARDLGPLQLGDGFRDAFIKLWVAWWREWVTAANAGDETRAATAAAATGRLRSLLPYTVTRGGHKLVLELTSTQEWPAREDLERLAARARGGDMTGIKEWLAYQQWFWNIRLDWASYGSLKLAYDGPDHPVTWAGGDAHGSGGLVSVAAARQEYASTQQLIGLPPSAAWPAWPTDQRRRREGSGFEHATAFAWITWWREWVAAARAGDAQRVAVAAAASARLHELLAGGRPSDDAPKVTLSAAALRDFEAIDARARRGDLQAIKDWLTYQAIADGGVGLNGSQTSR